MAKRIVFIIAFLIGMLLFCFSQFMFVFLYFDDEFSQQTGWFFENKLTIQCISSIIGFFIPYIHFRIRFSAQEIIKISWNSIWNFILKKIGWNFMIAIFALPLSFIILFFLGFIAIFVDTIAQSGNREIVLYSVSLLCIILFLIFDNLLFSEFEIKEPEVLKQNPESTPFQKALQQCETKIADFSQKVAKASNKLNELNNQTFLTEAEKSTIKKQLLTSKTLYQKQLNNYTDSFFKLQLSEQKQALGQMINEVFNQSKEVDGAKLKAIQSQVSKLLKHNYWKHTNGDKTHYQSLIPILTKLEQLDKREDYAKELADLAPTKDLLNLDDHELQTQIELADLKNTENLAQQTLTEFTQSTQLLNDELARLQAENEVADKFG